MNIAFVGEVDPQDVRSWSGLPRHMLDALRAAGQTVTPVGPMTRPAWPTALRYGYRLTGRRYQTDRAAGTLASFAAQAARQIGDADLVFSPGSIVTTKLDVPQPKVFWSDATFASMLGYYTEFSGLPKRTIAEGHAQEREAIGSAALCVYASQWAADSAIADYGADPARVRVIPFGANVDAPPIDQVRAMIDGRASGGIELLFIGSDWHRKGGPFAADVARRLGARLTVIGAQPDLEAPHVRYLGWLDKSVPEQARALEQALADAHFFILPTRAECAGVVFAEAGAYGLPSVSFDTGGVGTMVVDGRNGLLFDLQTSEQTVADGIADALSDYRAVARRARDEFDARLNWQVSTAALLEACGPLVGGAAPAAAAAGASGA